MPPILALGLTCLFVAWLFLRDEGRRDDSSWVLWLPLAWLLITGTRFVSQWLSLGTWSGPTTSADGSPLDAVVFGGLTLAGLAVLAQRRLAISDLARQNPWIVLLLLYGLISVLWSDFPFVSVKRWIKALGNPVMALVLLTDPDPQRAFRTVVRRLGYVVLPFSVMLIKYFPEYGRGFDAWTGQASYQGVALTKNGLGLLCFVIGIALVLSLQLRQEPARTSIWPSDRWVTVGLLVMLGWLMYMSDSKTSLMVLIVGLVTLVLLNRLPGVRRRFTLMVIAGTALVLAADLLFGFYTRVITVLGRNPNLTDRTEVWADVVALQPNVWIGAGYEAFWLGERLEKLWSIYWWQPNQSHNGYIEMYANGGLVGIALLLGIIVSAFASIARDLKNCSGAGADWARLRMAFLLMIIIYNYTEATFKGVNVIWTIFYLVTWKISAVTIASSNRHSQRAVQTLGASGAHTPHGRQGKRRRSGGRSVRSDGS